MPEHNNIKIINPYKAVDWNTWQAYKANLHAHSILSDGKDNFADVIEEYYRQGYDILAMTDHGVLNKGWNKKPKALPVFAYQTYFNKVKYVSQERYNEITSGADRGGRGMTDLNFGIELNAAVLNKNHVNGFFVDYGQGKWGKENDYESVIKAVDKRGGLSHINHPGDWLGSAKDINIAKDHKNVSFFANILKRYDSCLGIEILNSHDRPTRHDRVLWDALLERLIPEGRNVWGFANSDSHKFSDIDTSFTYFMLQKNDIKNIRKAMIDGCFFACGRHAKLELGEDFNAKGEPPLITKITVNEKDAKITIDGKNFNEIEWISKGKLISKEKNLDIKKHIAYIGSYVRVQLKGEGGICMSQPFIIDREEAFQKILYTPFFDSTLDEFLFKLKSVRIYVIVMRINKEIYKAIKKGIHKRRKKK